MSEVDAVAAARACRQLGMPRLGAVKATAAAVGIAPTAAATVLSKSVGLHTRVQLAASIKVPCTCEAADIPTADADSHSLNVKKPCALNRTCYWAA